MPELRWIGARRACDFGNFFVVLRQEFVQGQIKQADGDRQPLHRLEDRAKVAALHRQQLGKRAPALFARVGEDHAPHRNDPVGLEEHVFGAAEADAFGAEAPRRCRIGRRIGIAAYF